MPFFVVLTLVIGFGIALWLAPITVRYRDVPFALPFLLQLWMYATPIIYPVTLVPPKWRWVLSLNPMTGPIEGFRWSLLGGAPPGYGAARREHRDRSRARRGRALLLPPCRANPRRPDVT